MRFLKPNGLNQKKGISSIVGGIFFLVLMTAGFTVYYVALDSQSQMINTQQIIADNEVAKIKEKFIVAASSDPGDNNLLSVQVINLGNSPIEIADVWIINKTDANEPATKYNNLDYRDVSVPVGHNSNVLDNHNPPLYLISDIYDIKVVSSLGTIQTVEYDVAGGSNVLKAQMVAIPQDVRFNENATVALIVTNTGNFDIDTVTAGDLDVDPNQCSGTQPNPIFVGPANLSPSQSTMFFWDCIMTTPIGNDITFTANATGFINSVQVDSNNAFDIVTVRDFSAGNFGDELILKDELFGKPEIFMLLPNVFGYDADSNGYFGVNIANPTNKTMTVSKVSISILRGNANDNTVVIPSPCTIVQISPNDGNWSCPNKNIIVWKSPTTPLTINRQSAYPFIVTVEPGQASLDMDTTVVSASVFSSLGAFGKGPYELSIHEKVATSGSAIANAYLQDANGGGNIQGVLGNVTSQQTITFNATMADRSDDPPGIDQVSQLIVNVPKEWEFDSIGPDSGFGTIIDTTFADNSTQIVATLDSDLENTEAWFQFDATAPGNTSGNAKMYVFHILGTGITTASTDPFLIGPIAETIVQVCPTSGGPPGCP